MVLGAGVSKPYGFPLGSELVDQARACSEPPPEISPSTWSAFHAELFQYETEVCLLGKGERSLDAFVHKRRQEKRCDDVDKAVSRFITRAILQAEYRAKSGNALREDSPLKTLVQAVVDGEGNLSLRGRQVVFKTFNFDRVLEMLLVAEYRRRPSLKGVSEAVLGERTNAAVEHIHGRIQDLGVSKSQARIEFGEVSDWNICKSADRVLHTHEIAGSKVLPEKRCAPSSSEVAFLGFGYHKTNVSKLLPIQNRTVLKKFPEGMVGHCHFHGSTKQDVLNDWFHQVGIVETCPQVFVNRLIRGA